MIIIGVIASQSHELPKTVAPTITSATVGTSSITWYIRNNESATVTMEYSVSYPGGPKGLPIIVDSGSKQVSGGATTSVYVSGLDYGWSYTIVVTATASGKQKSDEVEDSRYIS